MNKVILMGRLTRDPDVRYSQGDSPMAIARYTLAVDRRFRRDNDQQTADFISCVAFGRNGEFAEKYLKHLIDQYDHDEQRLDLRTRTLRTHNLSQLMNYLSNEMGMEIPLRVKRDINALNNYYFNARYPGDNSFFVSKDDIEICKEGLDSCRELVLSVDKEMRTKNKEKELISENIPIVEDEEWDI